MRAAFLAAAPAIPFPELAPGCPCSTCASVPPLHGQGGLPKAALRSSQLCGAFLGAEQAGDVLSCARGRIWPPAAGSSRGPRARSQFPAPGPGSCCPARPLAEGNATFVCCSSWPRQPVSILLQVLLGASSPPAACRAFCHPLFLQGGFPVRCVFADVKLGTRRLVVGALRSPNLRQLLLLSGPGLHFFAPCCSHPALLGAVLRVEKPAGNSGPAPRAAVMLSPLPRLSGLWARPVPRVGFIPGCCFARLPGGCSHPRTGIRLRGHRDVVFLLPAHAQPPPRAPRGWISSGWEGRVLPRSCRTQKPQPGKREHFGGGMLPCDGEGWGAELLLSDHPLPAPSCCSSVLGSPCRSPFGFPRSAAACWALASPNPRVNTTWCQGGRAQGVKPAPCAPLRLWGSSPGWVCVLGVQKRSSECAQGWERSPAWPRVHTPLGSWL